MLNFSHFQIYNLMRVKATRVVSPIALIAPNLDLCLTVAPNLTPGVVVGDQVWAPSIILQLLGGLLVMETSLDYEN